MNIFAPIGMAFDAIAQWLGYLVQQIPLKYRVKIWKLDRKMETFFCRAVAVVGLCLLPFLAVFSIAIGALLVFFITLFHQISNHWKNFKTRKGNRP